MPDPLSRNPQPFDTRCQATLHSLVLLRRRSKPQARQSRFNRHGAVPELSMPRFLPNDRAALRRLE